jgi:alpha-ribazole phosphatase
MMPATRWWWIRHAPVPGIAGALHGQNDVDCDTGCAAAIGATAALLPEDAVLVVSPLRRARQTLDAILAGRDEPDAVSAVIEPRFAEQHFGRWQGRTWGQIEAEDGAACAAFWQDPTANPPPEGESFTEQIARAEAAIAEHNARFAGRNIVCVAHGGTIRAAIAVALALPPAAAMAIVIDPLSLTRLDWLDAPMLRGHGGQWRIAGVNVLCRWIC